ncbi:PAS/PAC sensor hybrid histidine kinase [Rhodopseudomonas thermotolerans]|uniref:histidine kinase n=2 Tax=Rhodopseudomonas TaxID=1073 RepID=A0A336K6G3_9BRAD|nr:PAS/PAC sensor hybrid histidine kinase [Rhodopseudomonas pentothenatexigens]REF86860.1 PAS/PAC sensor hybrid histidine kinase [Rhodopseudomonas thermotolerans]SSW93731.1 PAS/PAC sensor hybrid histidine kinase [Rhodopseudomonas pentothenatexigens]
MVAGVSPAASAPKVPQPVARERAVQRRWLVGMVIGTVASVLLGALVAYGVAEQNDRTAARKFGWLAADFADRLEDILDTYRFGLLAARGVVVASGGEAIGFDTFRRYAETRDFLREFPGARGFGFVRPVEPQDLAAFVAQRRADGQPTYRVSQLAPHDGPRYLVTYLEPSPLNVTALGIDLASESRRKTAADAAATSGEATMTAPIELLPISGMDSGVLILLPVYRNGDPIETEEQRRRALIGWTFTAIDIYKILADLHSGMGEFGFALTDSGGAPFHTVGKPQDAGQALPTREISFAIYGRTWHIQMWALPPFVNSLSLPSPWLGFTVTLALGLLLTSLVNLLISYKARRAEQNIERSRLAAIFESSNDAIIAKSIDGTVTDWNKAAERLFGYSAEEATGRPTTDLIVPDDLQDEENRIFADIRDGQKVSHFRTKRTNRRGDLIDVAISVSPIRCEDGSLVGIATAARDITELVAAEAKVRGLNAALERLVAERTAQLEKTLTLQTAILERAAYAVIATDVTGTITLFNPAAERMLGYKAEDLIGRATAMLFHDPEELGARAEQMRQEGIQVGANLGVLQARLARNDPDTAVWTYIDAEGHRIPTRLTLSLLRTKDGTHLGVLGIAVDLTEQLQYEDELKAARASAERAGAAKADFLANMSHEIRTPLNGIIGYADLVLEDQTLAPGTRRQVSRIFEASDSLRVIIDDILDFSKIEACGVKLENKPLYIDELIANCASIIEPKADEKGLRLVATARDTPPVLIGDAARLRQVLLNLMNNAVKFTSAGSVELIVSCASRTAGAARLRIAVTDSGIGISPEEQQGLFRRFSQADETISRKYGGTGLGLAISQRIVQAMGGELKIDSEPGVGSTFYFEVDMAIAEQIDIERGELPTRCCRSARILVVDDVEMNRDLCRTMLSRDGHEVDLADSGGTAIAMVASRAYDLIFMDVQMGEMDGMEATRRIRALQGEHFAVPIVALTANVLPEQVARYKAAGMDDHVGKPIARAELLACVARWLDGGIVDVPSGPLAPVAASPDLDAPVHDHAAVEDLRLFASDEDIAGFATQLRDAIARIRVQWPHHIDTTELDDESRRALASTVHKTVSLAGQLGFSQLAAACRRMEIACEPNRDIPDAFAALHAAIENAEPALQTSSELV